MEPKLGRFFEGRHHETKMLLKVVLDLSLGLGPDVRAGVDGREMVFRCRDTGRGFMRVIPQETRLLLGFPRGQELFDPLSRAKGPVGLQKTVVVGHARDVDGYLRRMIREAYDLEAR